MTVFPPTTDRTVQAQTAILCDSSEALNGPLELLGLSGWLIVASPLRGISFGTNNIAASRSPSTTPLTGLSSVIPVGFASGFRLISKLSPAGSQQLQRGSRGDLQNKGLPTLRLSGGSCHLIRPSGRDRPSSGKHNGDDGGGGQLQFDHT